MYLDWDWWFPPPASNGGGGWGGGRGWAGAGHPIPELLTSLHINNGGPIWDLEKRWNPYLGSGGGGVEPLPGSQGGGEERFVDRGKVTVKAFLSL